jgi:orotidine-5'-phosphate decarboxylase
VVDHPQGEGIAALIIAVDRPTLDDALKLVDVLRPITPWFKVGSVLFTGAGPTAVTALLNRGGRVCLDLKFHDIAHTVAAAAAAAADLGVSLLTVHCAGGAAMLEAAAAGARRAGAAARVLGVTRLTSEPGRVGAAVMRAAEMAHAAGLGGVVASARECGRLKSRFGSHFHVLTPGIRPTGSGADDQARIATPRQAVLAGADYVVVGRPITHAPDPAAAARAILAEMERATRGTAPAVRAAGDVARP